MGLTAVAQTAAAAGAMPAAPPAKESVRLLTFSTLFPNPAQPNHGIFVENRLRHLLRSGLARATVLAPVPCFPGRHPPRLAIPAREERAGLVVYHPRFFAPPGVGAWTNPYVLYRVARRIAAALIADGVGFDLIDAHYLYPDGVAAVWLGRHLRKPVVLTARGSDASQLPEYRLPGRLIRRAVAEATTLIAVSDGVKQNLLSLGADGRKVTVLRNGVDLATFHPPSNRQELRRSLGLRDGPLLLAVGRLVPLKGFDRIVSALAELPGCTLLLAGEGPERPALEALIRRLGIGDRVRLLGAVPHADLVSLYGAADALVLASDREGWPNVVLEAMACGTPVVATRVFGVVEMLAAPEAGVVIGKQSVAAIADGVRRLLAHPPDRAKTRACAERFSWDATTAGQLALFRRVLESA